MRSGGICVAAILLAGTAGAAWAQPAPAPAAPAASPAPAAAPHVVVRRIVLLPRMEDVTVAGLPAQGPDVDASRAPALGDAQAEAALRRLVGRTIDEAYLAEVKAALAAQFKRLHHPFVGVIVPRQDVTSGALQVVVVESRVGKVTVEGAHWFGEDQYRNALHAKPGGPIDNDQLHADIDRINQNPYRHATVTAQPGAQSGETDVVVQTQEQRPLVFNVGFNNAGNDSTGLNQVTLGFDWGNALGRGDDLNYEFTGSAGAAALRQHSLSYAADLPWGHSLTLSGSYAQSRSAQSIDIASTGLSADATIRYAIPLPPWRGGSQHLTLGYDYKSTNNDILFGGMSVFPNLSDVDQFVVEYAAQVPDRWGQTSLIASVFASPGGLTAHNHDADFDVQEAGAKSRYAYLRATLSRATRLPLGVEWDSRAIGQLSDGRLLPSEQLELQGVQAVRGFIEQGSIRDEGLVWRNELRPPPITGAPAGRSLGQVSLSPFGFVDAGVGQDHQLAAGPGTWVSVVSAGAGVDVQLGRLVSAHATLGAPLATRGVVGRRLAFQVSLQATF